MRCREIFGACCGGVRRARAVGACCGGLGSKKTAWGLLGGVPSSRGLVVPAVGAEVGEKFFLGLAAGCVEQALARPGDVGGAWLCVAVGG